MNDKKDQRFDTVSKGGIIIPNGTTINENKAESVDESKTLDWMTYRTLADRTVSTLFDNQLIHALHGLNTEALEFYTAASLKNAIEEIGDWFWYLALLANRWDRFGEFRWTIDEIANLLFERGRDERNNVSEKAFLIHTAHFSDQSKRILFYGAEVNQKILEDSLLVCGIFMMKFCKEYKKNPLYVLHANIEKLQKRFPEKFTQEQALNRDTDNELSHIEEK